MSLPELLGHVRILRGTDSVISGSRVSSKSFTTVESTALDVPLASSAFNVAKYFANPGGRASPSPRAFSTVVALYFANSGGRASPSPVVALCIAIPEDRASAFATVVSTTLALSHICASSTRSLFQVSCARVLERLLSDVLLMAYPLHALHENPIQFAHFFLQHADCASRLDQTLFELWDGCQNSARQATACCRSPQSPRQKRHPGHPHWALH